VERGASAQRGVRVDGAVALLNEADDALLIDHNVRAQRPLVRFLLDVVALQDAVGGEHLVIHVTKKRETNIDLLGKGSIGGRAIHANAENCGI
jgi:hypothetical protein